MTDQFNTHPQPRTFAPSKEDVLQNLQYFFGAPVSPEKLKDYSEQCAAPCSRRRPSDPNSQPSFCLRVRSHAVPYHFPDAYVGQNSKSPPQPPSTPCAMPLTLCSFAFSPRHAQQPHPQVPAVVA